MSKSQVSTAANTQQPPAKRRHKSMAKIKLSTVAIYISVFALIVTAVTVGYREPKKTTATSNVANSSTIAEIDQTSVDNVVATAVAADVAETTNLPIANAVSNLAVSAEVKSLMMQADTTNVTKPQIIESRVPNRSVINYKVNAEDTIESLTAKYSITAQTIKWANNMTNDTLVTGTTIRLLPINGVLYTVKAGDTADAIASKYNVDKTLMITYNDLEVSGLQPNSEIILPNGNLPEEERPGYVSPRAIYNYGVAYGYAGGDVVYLNTPPYMNDTLKAYLPHLNSLYESSPGNPMHTWYTGQCTWWAWERRIALGRPLPSGVPLGNGGYWHVSLGSYGYLVDRNPEVGAIFESSGHVGIVERINTDSSGNIVSFTTSEMNWSYRNYLVVARTIPANNFENFFYIH